MQRVRPQEICLATSQFAVSADVRRNTRVVLRHIEQAAQRGADAVLFPEAALTGYPGVDRESLEDLDRAQLVESIGLIRARAAEQGCWVLVGAAHFLSGDLRPTNCVYVIGPDGRIRTRYDKRMLYGRELEHYTPGSSLVTFTIRGVRCGVLICFDSWFQDLYAELEARRVRVLFHAYYNAGRPGQTTLDNVMGAQVTARAFDHSYAIVASNSSRRHSHMSARIVLPDGRQEALVRHKAGVLVQRIPTEDSFWGYRAEASPRVRAAIAAHARSPRHPRLDNRRAGP